MERYGKIYIAHAQGKKATKPIIKTKARKTLFKKTKINKSTTHCNKKQQSCCSRRQKAKKKTTTKFIKTKGKKRFSHHDKRQHRYGTFSQKTTEM